jgi:hypothetical protein
MITQCADNGPFSHLNVHYLFEQRASEAAVAVRIVEVSSRSLHRYHYY